MLRGATTAGKANHFTSRHGKTPNHVGLPVLGAAC
jgi:hypothetical protein